MSLWGRLFAAGYDTLMASTERAGLAARRAELLSEARGRVLELGGGTGVNLAHYPVDLARLVVTEPEAPMARRLRERAAATRPDAEIVAAGAERLPFPDDSFDTVVCTLVLCTVGDPGAALAEVRRVLADSGRLLFIEHVRSEDAALARWQDRLHPLWLRFGHGCNCNRPTLETIERAGLRADSVQRSRLPKSPPIVRPLIVGTASPEPGAVGAA
jgi:ubiquinone/menaquinone biosynthesis C-methylase UbiE